MTRKSEKFYLKKKVVLLPSPPHVGSQGVQFLSRVTWIVQVNGNSKLIASIVAALIYFRPQKLINLIRYSQFLRVVFVNKHSQLNVKRDEEEGCDLTSLPSTLNGRTFVEDTRTSRRKEKMKNYSHFFKVFN